jgi:hypothetical protein
MRDISRLKEGGFLDWRICYVVLKLLTLLRSNIGFVATDICYQILQKYSVST